jgi:hypothetical protein
MLHELASGAGAGGTGAEWNRATTAAIATTVPAAPPTHRNALFASANRLFICPRTVVREFERSRSAGSEPSCPEVGRPPVLWPCLPGFATLCAP